MKCVRCKERKAFGDGITVCLACYRILVRKQFWSELVKKAAK